MKPTCQIFPSITTTLAALALATAQADIVFTESFETPDVTGQPGTDPDGWTTTGHPNYQSLVDVDTGEFTTPHGSQALSCYTQTTAANWAYSETTSSILDYNLDANASYALAFNVAAVAGRPRAAYRAELVAIDDGTGTATILASTVANSNGSTDMSSSDSVSFTPDASHDPLVGQRIAIRLGMDYDYNLHGAAYQDKPRFDNVTLDIVAPLGFLSGVPADNGLGVDIPSDLVATFNLDLAKVSGNLTLRNLTNPVDTVALAIGDPRIRVAGKDLLIETAGLLDWNTSYAIRIDPGALESTTGVVFAGINDDTTWNFTTAIDDPLLLALEALKAHVDGTTPLTGPEIAAHKATVDAKQDDFDKTTDIITAAMDLVTTYDTVEGPLFLSTSTVKEFNRNNTTPGDNRRATDDNIHWVVLGVMQSVLDEACNASSLADSAKRDLLDGYLFGSSADFPGSVAIPGSPVTHTATISASFPETFGRDTQHWDWPARKPTGCYLAPGSIVTVEVPPALVGQGIQIRVGAHSWDHEEKNRPPVKRLSRATILYDVDSTSTDIASPYGGGIYFEIPKGLDLGVVDVDITGAVRSPYFSVKPFHTTTDAEWINTERNHPAPWADFQTEKFMMQVPASWVNAVNDPTARMAKWDAAMDAINDLMGFPRIRGKETMYIQTDVIFRSSVHAPGYPATNVNYNPKSSYNGDVNNYFVRGPRSGASTEFHEQGHAYFFPKFGGETEANVNLLYVPVLTEAFGVSLDEAFRSSIGFPGANVDPLDKTAVLWMTSFNFAPREQPMASWEKAYQPQGHAKWVDLARLFGWDGMGAYWQSYMADDANGTLPANPSSTDNLLIRLCRNVGEDIRPLFHFWGIHPQDPAALEAAVQAEGLHPSSEIYNLLQHYRTLVPADNSSYQDFCRDWYSKDLNSLTGYGVEREHCRQWDSSSYWLANGWSYGGTADTNPDGTPIVDDGEIYTAASATRLQAVIDNLAAVYFDDHTPWALQFPGADLDDPDADLDGDGMSNGDERIWGLDPTRGNEMSPISAPPEGISADFTYTRRDDALTGKNFTVWISHDLVNWTPDPGAVQDPGDPDADGVEIVEVTLSPAVFSAPEVFVRMSAE